MTPAAALPRSTVDEATFNSVYRQGVAEVMARMPDDWSAFASHNAGWRKGHFDAEGYLLASAARYWRAYGILRATRARRILDIGGFLAAFPLALRRLGYDVALAERYDYTRATEIAANLGQGLALVFGLVGIFSKRARTA